jgi:hypothetical protein
MNSHRISLLLAGTVTIAGMVGAQAHSPFAPAEKHVLKNVVLDSGNPGTTLSKGYTTLEQATVSCGNYYGCTLAMRIMANVGTATCTSDWAIVGLVDGNSVDGSPLQESLPRAGNTQSNVWHGVYNVAFGSHTITFQLYLPCAANANQWSVRYLIAVP